MNDDDVLAALRGRSGAATYVVRNVLRDRFPAITTPQVLRRLKRLERAGKVVRVRTYYAVMLAWGLAPPFADGARPRTLRGTAP